MNTRTRKILQLALKADASQKVHNGNHVDQDLRSTLCSNISHLNQHGGHYDYQNEERLKEQNVEGINGNICQEVLNKHNETEKSSINEESEHSNSRHEVLDNGSGIEEQNNDGTFHGSDISSQVISDSSHSEYIPNSDADVSSEKISDSSTNECIPKSVVDKSADEFGFSLNSNNSPVIQGDHSTSETNLDGVIVSFGKFVNGDSTVEQFKNTRPWTKKSTCPYCFQDVTHFPRHLKRQHPEEGAVKEFAKMSFKDPQRKDLLNAIRRQGNFISTTTSSIIRPVRRPRGESSGIESNVENQRDKYVLCKDCLGYFKRNYLRRHRKRCSMRPKTSDQTKNREQHLSAAQLVAVCSGRHSDFYSTLRLKSEVFPIMRNDRISRIAMEDVLICSYGESLLRKHKRTNIRNVISNKMRELGRLLCTLKDTAGAQQLYDILKPQFFDNLVSATKVISGYDQETRSFQASSLALHMGTTLKQVCDIATKLIIKKSPLLSCSDSEGVLKEVKRLKSLIENHWNSEISSLALKNLNERRYEKQKLLPLTKDVMKFQQYVLEEAKKACRALEGNHEIKKSYRRLSECVLSLTLLLNRKRIGEIQFLKLRTYSRIIPQNQQNEFLEALSETEKTLNKKFKRVVTEGKGSKPVAILFPQDIQQFIEVLSRMRNLCVPKTNEYLFANPSTATKSLDGYHTLKKLAEEAGVANKDLFTSTRLRKQIATVLQVMNITEDEMEQFAKFMGHTRKTHESFYRLPQDVYQTAKVSKLLLAINSGKASAYKGKTLNEIELSDKETYDSEFEDNRDTDNKHPSIQTLPAVLDEKNRTDAQKIKICRVRWTTQQKELMEEHFENHIKTKRAPRKHEVEAFIQEHKETFSSKNWVKIKAYVFNRYK